MRTTRFRRTAAVALSAALLLAACGSGDEPEADDLAAGSPTAEATEQAEPSPEPTAESSPESTAEESPEPSPEPSPSPCPEGQQRIVSGGECFTPSPEPSPEPEPEPTEEETQAAEPEPEPEPANPCDDRAAQGYSLTAVNFEFSTTSLTGVCSGDTVTLTVDEGSHSFTVNGAEGDTGVFGSGESRTTTVSGTPGTYTYKCTLHPNQMSGQIEIIG